MLRIVNIVGTRPNLVKVAALLAAQRARADVIEPLVVHTGQHRDPAMSAQLLDDLALPPPDLTLGAHGDTHLSQIGGIVQELETVLPELRPDLVVVVGDVNSTAAGALAAASLGIPVAHVEAGLRSFDRTMPEEVNRVVVDAVSDWLFASEASGVDNLRREGRPPEAIFHVGNVMIDTLVRCLERSAGRSPATALGIDGRYAVLTLHRPANVDEPGVLGRLLRASAQVAQRLPVVFPIHPRTRDRLLASGLMAGVQSIPGLHATAPLGYLDMLALMRGAAVVLTDSGGVQEETTFLGVPCLTLRANTERPATVTDGTNRVIGTRPLRLLREVERILDGDRPTLRVPPLWDGHAADRVVAILAALAESRALPQAG